MVAEKGQAAEPRAEGKSRRGQSKADGANQKSEAANPKADAAMTKAASAKQSRNLSSKYIDRPQIVILLVPFVIFMLVTKLSESNASMQVRY